MNNTTELDFDGVFRFTNASDEDIEFLWNNVKYLFKAGTCSPMIIKGEDYDNIQEIRKMWARKYATREFYKSSGYDRLVALGNKSAMGIPPTYSDDELEPWIQQCLQPLPQVKAMVTETKQVPPKMKAFKTVGEKTNLKEAFQEELNELAAE